MNLNVSTHLKLLKHIIGARSCDLSKIDQIQKNRKIEKSKNRKNTKDFNENFRKIENPKIPKIENPKIPKFENSKIFN